MYMHVKAIESLSRPQAEKLPINVRVIIEGEEEVGGEGIARFVREHPERLKADFALVSDTEMFAPDLPTLCVGLRGMCYTELEASGAMTDLHSGMYGGAAPNPLEALARIISKLKDESGKILIPHFYDKVQKPSGDELQAWKSLPFNEEHYRKTEVGSKELTGEAGYTVLGAHVGASDPGSARHARRIHRRGWQDGHPGARLGENLNAACARYASRRDLQALQRLCAVAGPRAASTSRSNHSAWLTRSLSILTTST